MTKVLFVKPQLETDAVWDPVRTCSYLGIWSLASLLKEKGHDVTYLDEVVRDGGLSKRSLFKRKLVGGKVLEENLGISYEEFHEKKMKDYETMTPKHFVEKYSAFNTDGIERIILRTGQGEAHTIEKIREIEPDIIGIPLIATANYLPATRLARKIKEAFPDKKIIFGGQHITSDPEGFLRDNPYVDQVVTGDAISCIEDIVEGRNSQRIVDGGVRHMNDFPIFDPSIIEPTGYPVPPTYTYPTQGRKSVDFMFSKGCSGGCDFCVAGSIKGNKVTSTEYDKLDLQLKLLYDYGIRELVIQDDAFLHNENHLKAILSLMKKYGFYWQNNGGVAFEQMNERVTQMLIDYNSCGEGRVTALYVPFNPRQWNKHESAAHSMSEKYHKNTENLKRLRQEAGVYVFTSAIIGTPEQTKETFLEELETDKKLIQQGYIDAALPLSATMLPGTRWYENNGHNIIDKTDYPGYSLFATHHRTENLSARDIEEMMITWVKKLDSVQKTYKWGSAFANSDS